METGSNEPIHDGMMRLEQSVRHFLETYNIQVWGDLVGFDAENKPRWKAPPEVPEKLRELMSRKTRDGDRGERFPGQSVVYCSKY